MFVTPPAASTPTAFVTCVPFGKMSITTTFVAVDGPAFVTVIVFV